MSNISFSPGPLRLSPVSLANAAVPKWHPAGQGSRWGKHLFPNPGIRLGGVCVCGEEASSWTCASKITITSLHHRIGPGKGVRIGVHCCHLTRPLPKPNAPIPCPLPPCFTHPRPIAALFYPSLVLSLPYYTLSLLASCTLTCLSPPTFLHWQIPGDLLICTGTLAAWASAQFGDRHKALCASRILVLPMGQPNRIGLSISIWYSTLPSPTTNGQY